MPDPAFKRSAISQPRGRSQLHDHEKPRGNPSQNFKGKSRTQKPIENAIERNVWHNQAKKWYLQPEA